jgi:hypothetical protein
MFLYMPFMHSEALADQDRCVRLFERLAADVPAIDSRGWAHQHRDIRRASAASRTATGCSAVHRAGGAAVLGATRLSL